MKKKVRIIVLLCCMIALAGVSIAYVSFQKSYDELVEQIYTDISEIRLTKAYLEYCRAVRMNPQRTEAYEAYAALLMVQGDREQVLQVLTDSLNMAQCQYQENVYSGETVVRIAKQLAEYYLQWNCIEDAVNVLRGVPEELVTEEISENLEFLTGKRVIQLQDYAIEWEDSAMEAAVRKLLKKPQGEIMASEVWNITFLEIWGDEVFASEGQVEDYDRTGFWKYGNFLDIKGNIRTLEDLKHFQNLEELSINFQEDLSLDFFAEKQLTRLRKISFVNDGIKEIQPLMLQSGLTILNLDYNFISEFMWVSRMERLNELSARGNVTFWSMEDLGGMGGLRSLDVRENSMVDFDKIAEIESLEELKIDVKTDFQNFEYCGNLRKLTISVNELTINYLKEIPNLYELNLTIEGDFDIFLPDNLGSLRKISLTNQGNTEMNLQILKKFPYLEEVKICNGRFANYNTLGGCGKLNKVILLSENQEMYQVVAKYVPREIIEISPSRNH